MAVGHEGAALARGAEAEAFEREQNRWRKIVVNHQGGKLVLADAGHGVDLVRGGLHGRAPEVVRWHGGTGKCGSLREAADVDGRLGQVLRAFRREIGRASCRERVCQYVKISVVAVSLKKKNKELSITYFLVKTDNTIK